MSPDDGSHPFDLTHVIERLRILLVAAVIAITVVVAVTYYSPDEGPRVAKAEARLKQIADLIVAYDAQHHPREYEDSDLSGLPGLDSDLRLDPWGNAVGHSFAGGFVFSLGPNGPAARTREWVRVYYRPPSAKVVARWPRPDATASGPLPTIWSTWRLECASRITSATVALDDRAMVVSVHPSWVMSQEIHVDPEGARSPQNLAAAYERARAEPGRVEFSPPQGLSPGVHKVRFEVTDDRNHTSTDQWRFRVAGSGR